jgi:hypothetical protein
VQASAAISAEKYYSGLFQNDLHFYTPHGPVVNLIKGVVAALSEPVFN